MLVMPLRVASLCPNRLPNRSLRHHPPKRLADLGVAWLLLLPLILQV
jgi:hypothetical protein